MERLKKIGHLKTCTAQEMGFSRLGLGLEKLDRDLYDPANAYDLLANLGVKWIRLQSGWMRTEKQEGVYDFAWLDDIVDNLIKRGMIPWLDLVYGNPIYTEDAKPIFGAVGRPPIWTEKELTAWQNYVKALVRHFKGRVEYFEIWNEPDCNYSWRVTPNAKEYGECALCTARAIHAADKNAKAIGGAMGAIRLSYIRTALDTGMGREIDAFSFHRYNAHEQQIMQDVLSLRALLNEYNPDIKLIQGESGTQSSSQGAGALSGGAWDEEKQMKYLLRHRVIDMAAPLFFTSHFSALDMAEALRGTNAELASRKDYGYFGVLNAQFGEDGRCLGTYKPKKSYYALMQVAAALGSEDVKPCLLPLQRKINRSPRYFANDCEKDITIYGFERKGKRAMAYWRPADLMTETYQGTVSFECPDCFGKDPVLVELRNGNVYELPEEYRKDGEFATEEINNLPVSDTPMLLMDRDFAGIIFD